MAFFLRMSFLMNRYCQAKKTAKELATATGVHEKIGALTYHLYLKHGCPEGQEMNFWRQARDLVTGESAVPNPLTSNG